MSTKPKISSILPERAIPGAQIEILVSNLMTAGDSIPKVFANGIECRVTAMSSKRILANLPKIDDSSAVIQIETHSGETNGFVITLGKEIANEMHIVANPAIDPSDDAMILTRSGSRGQQLANTIFRLETDGYLDELPVQVLNPTGIAFGPSGGMFVTNRAEGTVLRIERGEEAVVVATDLGVATGIAFDRVGMMYVGDRSGTIYRVSEMGDAETFATLEPSVAAYHLAFGPDGRLYVSSPGFASHDAIYTIDSNGSVERYVRGLGRPQGLAFDREGNLYVAACHKGRHGVVRVDVISHTIEQFVAGNNLVGLCFTRNGEMVLATNDSAYSLNLGIYGTLLGN